MFSQRVSRCAYTKAQLFKVPVRPMRRMETALNASRSTLSSREFVRHQFNKSGPRPKGMDKLRQAYREHPILLPTGIASVIVSFLFLGYVNYVYFVQSVAFHNFPEPVAKELRKAIYYDKGYGQDPKKAFQYYKEALMVATDMRMNPFSEEFMGMRIRMAEFLEQHHQYEQAIVVLEKEKGYCYEFVEKTKEKDIPASQRTRMLKAAVKLGVKLGKLYSNDTIDNPEAAQVAFVTAVETLLKERQRREEEGVKDGEGDWLDNEEIGASLEELGHSYLDTKQPELALPLFLQALSLCPAKSCHAAMLMNQVSAALSLQRPGAVSVLDAPKGKSKPPTQTAANFRGQAKQWAEKALTLAQTLPAPDRTEECDIACAVTTHNLAELADMSGDKVMARRLFQEAKSLAEAISFKDGVKEATQALNRLQSSIKD